ncbi:hypothetical protein GUJ93_ZPchr0001g31184 [Zizania palustris]|uniref:Uncharacterized protein n=1 Tax=Zizania palustris TaxID=103762 RepID=A0A8J5SB41_ZIZPA|nr:hypothetical protein GUJ93_ZPchr0001g31184 [Zizania palustris]
MTSGTRVVLHGLSCHYRRGSSPSPWHSVTPAGIYPQHGLAPNVIHAAVPIHRPRPRHRWACLSAPPMCPCDQRRPIPRCLSAAAIVAMPPSTWPHAMSPIRGPTLLNALAPVHRPVALHRSLPSLVNTVEKKW